MDIRTLTPGYSVSPQLSVEDMPAIAEAGYTTVICNRPDSEIGPEQSCAAMRDAAEAVGITFIPLPLDQTTLTPENGIRQVEAIADATGPVLGYCRTGTRSTVIWAMGQAGKLPVDEILTKASAAGYELEHLRPMLEALAASRS